MVQNHQRRLVRISQESFLLSYTTEIEDFLKFSRRTERHHLIQSIQKEFVKKEVFKNGEKINTRLKSSETPESVITGYGAMLIIPNQESEWVHQNVRNIPSPALCTRRNSSDFKAK